jgi:hypothetical protein
MWRFYRINYLIYDTLYALYSSFCRLMMRTSECYGTSTFSQPCNVVNYCALQVHGPPGGASSFSLGWGEPEVPKAAPVRSVAPAAADPYRPSAAASRAAPVYEEPASAAYGRVSRVSAPVAAPVAAPLSFGAGVSSNSYASGASQNSGTQRTAAPTGWKPNCSISQISLLQAMSLQTGGQRVCYPRQVVTLPSCSVKLNAARNV